MKKKIWFVTGISGGLGRAMADAALAADYYVVGTLRQPAQVAAFNQQHPGRAEALALDLTDEGQILAAAESLRHILAREDAELAVVVNNAGFGFAGAIEEASPAEARAVMEANFFGPMRLTQALLPLLRAQQSGHIIQISSHGGFKAFPGFGWYNAAKFALEGASEALAAEVAPLGIKLTLVQPGPFRTGFAGGNFKQAAQEIAAYGPTAGAFRQRMASVNGQQEGDPAKAAAAIVQLAAMEHPPLRQPLGKIALATLQAKLDSVSADLENGRKRAMATAY
jgi:NAD(P)-dependent dehydrogenase (short-subunit alcohol dehydrogenase family)